jgi:putative IMPACT (imprinted ancient) family translation regulator
MSFRDAGIQNAALSEEIEAVNAIYGSDVITSLPKPDNKQNKIYPVLLRPPNQSISFILSINTDYPDSCPRIIGTQSIGSLGKGEGQHAVTFLRQTLQRVWTPGAVCLFDLIEEASPLLQDGQSDPSSQAAAEKSDDVPSTHGDEETLTAPPAEAVNATNLNPNWTISEALTEKKSVFVARCAMVTDKDQANSFLTHLLSTNKKLAGATHNITAWRIRHPETGITIQDCDDDGETAAGGRLLRLLQLMDVWDVVVVVSRWYGGVKLGPDRFRLINQAAREVLVKGGFVRVEEEKSGKKKGRK